MGWLSDFLYKLNEYWSVSSELLIISHKMVIREFRELVIRSQENQMFTSKKRKGEAGTMSCLEFGLQSHQTGFDSWFYHLRTVWTGSFSGPQFPYWKMWLLIVLAINGTYLIGSLWETRSDARKAFSIVSDIVRHATNIVIFR